MTTMGKVISLLGASCIVAFAATAPAQAAPKPCCYNNGKYFESSVSTCRKYGGRIVNQNRCYRGSYNNNRAPVFAIAIGDIVFAYTDGYYDRNRRWHAWRNNNERDWYRKNYSGRFHGLRRDDDRDQKRRDWRRGRRQNWN